MNSVQIPANLLPEKVVCDRERSEKKLNDIREQRTDHE